MGRPRARCRDCSRSVSRGRPPNPACAFPAGRGSAHPGPRDGSEEFLRICPTDLTAVTAAAARAAGAVGEERYIDVVVDVPPHLAADVDPDRLRQVLDNLLANAVRHSPEHGVITLTLTTLAPRDDRAVITVADQGSGFPPKFLPHAFGFVVPTTPARAAGGSGLGLAIVETITYAHRGQVRATNRPEGGAQVQIDLPISAPPSTGALGRHPRSAQPTPPLAASTTSSPDPRDGNPLPQGTAEAASAPRRPPGAPPSHLQRGSARPGRSVAVRRRVDA